MHQKAVTYPDLYLNCNKIEHMKQFNYLGLILQAKLSWNKHISHISLKVKKTIGIVCLPYQYKNFTTNSD